LKHVVIETLPKARTEKLIIKELPDETLVYDLEQDKAHCLNHTAGLVWKHCDGKASVDEIAKSVGAKTHTVVDDRIVWLALDQLEEFRLLEKAAHAPSHLKGMSRRQMIAAVGVAATAIPLITSIVVPHAAQAQTCPAAPPFPDDCPCTTSAQCLTGCCRVVAGSQICKAGVGGCL
jgi:hypothetical protein